MKNLTTLFILITYSLTNFAQDTNNLVSYNKNYYFNDGLYFNINQVKNNNPVPPENIITTLNKKSLDFYDALILEDFIIIAHKGTNVKYVPNEVWGFAQNGNIYIYWNKRPANFLIFGTICQFIGLEQDKDYYYTNDNFGKYNDPIINLEKNKYFLDISTGKVTKESLRNFKELISDDKELFDQWSNLSRTDRKNSISKYIIKYNKRNPLLLPKN